MHLFLSQPLTMFCRTPGFRGIVFWKHCFKEILTSQVVDFFVYAVMKSRDEVGSFVTMCDGLEFLTFGAT